MFKSKLKLRYYKTIDGAKFYKLKEPLIYQSKDGNLYNVPRGTITNLASIPLWVKKISKRLFYWLKKITKKQSALHDYLYGTNLDRKLCDDLFHESFLEDTPQTNTFIWYLIADIFYYAVRKKGGEFKK